MSESKKLSSRIPSLKIQVGIPKTPAAGMLTSISGDQVRKLQQASYPLALGL